MSYSLPTHLKGRLQISASTGVSKHLHFSRWFPDSRLLPQPPVTPVALTVSTQAKEPITKRYEMVLHPGMKGKYHNAQAGRETWHIFGCAAAEGSPDHTAAGLGHGDCSPHPTCAGPCPSSALNS